MRLLTAIGLFMLSLALLLVGVAQRTVWAPPSSHQMVVNFDSGNPFVIVPAQTLNLYGGTPKVVVEGSKNIFVASAREADIAAWVGDTPHTILGLNKNKARLEATSIPGVGPATSPVGSDLWRTSVSAEQSAELVTPIELGGAALIASDGSKPAPSKITVIWPIAYDLTPSNLFLIFGFALLVLALILNFISYRTLRKRRGPSRKVPKAPQGPKARLGKQPRMAPPRGRRSAARKLAAPAGLLVLGLLSGCSATPNASAPTPTPTTQPGDPAVVTSSQLERILADVSLASRDGDAKNERAKIINRLAGPALEQRIAYYSLRKIDSKLPALPKIAAKPITFSLPAATTLWPRSIMVVTDEPGEESPQMLVLQQASPRSQYQLWYNIRLMSGIKVPSVPVAEVGAIPVAVDAKFLTIVPNKLPTIYGSIIDNGAGAPGAELFDLTTDEFFKRISESQDAQVAALKNGKIKFSHTLGSSNAIALATTEGGAIVAVSMIDGYTIRPTKRASAITVTGLEKTMLGASGSPTGIVSRYSDMLLFYVPPIGSERLAKILGVSQGLLSVRNL